MNETKDNKKNNKLDVNEDEDIQKLRKKIREVSEALATHKTKTELEQKLADLNHQLAETKPKSAGQKVMTGLKRDFGGLGKRLAAWWTMEGLTEQQKQQKKKQFMAATDNLFGNDTAHDDFPDPLGLFNNKPSQNTKSMMKKGGKQSTKHDLSDNQGEYVIVDGEAYPVATRRKTKKKKKNRKKPQRKQRHTTPTEPDDDEPKMFFDPTN